uniref:Uncharacterized protein n=1 Tax=Clastoptera arizonana TaxID=38151 RepID=A0A1B6CPR7_9HEMI
MKSAVLWFVLIAVVAAQDSRLDKVDVDEVIKNQRLYTLLFKCVLETGPCSPDGRELKSRIPEAIKTNCSGCTQQEKTLARKTIKTLMATHKEDWQKLINKYDPDKKYIKNLEKFLNEA